MNAHSTTLVEPTIDPRALRDALGHFATGVCVITTIGDKDAAVGVTANSFSSVSLDPPLVAWNLSLEAPSLSAFRNHVAFAINILCEQSKDLALNFAQPSDDKFSGIDWHPGFGGVPLINAAAATIECQTQTQIPAGDHEIHLGRVVGFTHSGKRPLVFHRGQFASLGGLI
jgi:flavin reductase (DIM6/NTAB) family NADH-FMN oxidoreductase RutF